MCINLDVYNEVMNVLNNHKIKPTKNLWAKSGLVEIKSYGKVGNPALSQNFGIVRKRYCNSGNPKVKFDSPFQPGSNNEKYPEVYEALKKLIKEIDPNFKYNSITLNKNFKTQAHFDKLNKSPSLIIGLGNYTGGELMIEDCPFDIKLNALIMNGSYLKHWTNDFEGDRYSVIYYNI